MSAMGSAVKPAVALQVIKLTLDGDTCSYEPVGGHEEGQPVIVVTNEPCVLTFPDEEVFKPKKVKLNAGENLLRPKGKKKSTFEVRRTETSPVLTLQAIAPTTSFKPMSATPFIAPTIPF